MVSSLILLRVLLPQTGQYIHSEFWVSILPPSVFGLFSFPAVTYTIALFTHSFHHVIFTVLNQLYHTSQE